MSAFSLTLGVNGNKLRFSLRGSSAHESADKNDGGQAFKGFSVSPSARNHVPDFLMFPHISIEN